MVFGGSVPLHDTTETQDAKCSLFEHGLRSFPTHHCTGSATPAMLQAQRDFWCSCESHTVSHRQEWHCGVPFLFNRGSYLGCWSHLTVRYQNRFSSVATLLPLPLGSYKTKCLALSRRRQRFEKKRVEDDEIELQEAGGLGEQVVTEEKGLEKTRVIESEGSGLKEAGARRDGREGFGKEEGDWGRRGWIKRSGGVGGAQWIKRSGGVGGAAPPQKQDVTEEKGLEKKRVIEAKGVD